MAAFLDSAAGCRYSSCENDRLAFVRLWRSAQADLRPELVVDSPMKLILVDRRISPAVLAGRAAADTDRGALTWLSLPRVPWREYSERAL